MTTLITGITGQDGSYLAEQLSAAGEHVFGTLHPHWDVPEYVSALQRAGVGLLTCDLADTSAFRHLLRELRPARVFHLAALSAPADANADPELSRRVNVASAEALCEWVRRDAPEARVLLASSGSIFAGAPLPQSEDSPASPQDEYGRQKLAVRELAAQARTGGSYVACAIPFNHESPRHDERFVFPKVCAAAVRIARGEQQSLVLGNLNVRRDWGDAPEYCAALALMLDLPEPAEIVLATGEAHSVRELVELAFEHAGTPLRSEADWRARVQSDFALHRAGDFDLCGDATRAQMLLGWEAEVKFAELVGRLVDA